MRIFRISCTHYGPVTTDGKEGKGNLTAFIVLSGIRYATRRRGIQYAVASRMKR